LDLTWKQSFLILVDSELFGRRSLYQFERLSEETQITNSTHYFSKEYSSKQCAKTFLK
jgi:hypothetical protein